MGKCTWLESVKKSASRGGLIALIATGLLGVMHTMSHLIPAIGILGYTIEGQAAEHTEEALMLFGINIGPFLFHPVMQIAYVLFVPLSFYYIYRDHQHHKEFHKVEQELERAKKELAKRKKK